MKEAVELAKSILGPRMISQQIDGPLKKPLEMLARAVLEAESEIEALKKRLEIKVITPEVPNQ